MVPYLIPKCSFGSGSRTGLSLPRAWAAFFPRGGGGGRCQDRDWPVT